MVVDSLRTGIVWTVSLALGWEPFSWIQVIGFLIIIFGSAMYNEVITFPCFVYPEKEAAPEDSSQPEKDSNNIPTERAVVQEGSYPDAASQFTPAARRLSARAHVFVSLAHGCTFIASQVMRLPLTTTTLRWFPFFFHMLDSRALYRR